MPQRHAAQALGNIGGARAVEALTEAQKDRGVEEKRIDKRKKTALRKIFNRDPNIEKLVAKRDINGLVKALRPERDKLELLCDKWCKEYAIYVQGGPHAGKASDNIERIRNEARSAGETIGDVAGGGSLARELMYQVAKSLDDPTYRQFCDSSWNGIHDWQY
jgi:HEAT repeat protein